MNSATREAFGSALVDLMGEREDIVALDADLAGATKSGSARKAYPERFFDMGIAEADMVATAAGLAACGKVPFASSFSVFVTGRSFEQVRQSVCYSNLNVKLVGTHAGPSCGEDGGTHQAIEDIAIMRSLPNMTVVVPGDDVETPIWDEYARIVAKYEPGAKIGHIERFKFYDEARKAYCVVATGETALYANVILQKGVVK